MDMTLQRCIKDQFTVVSRNQVIIRKSNVPLDDRIHWFIQGCHQGMDCIGHVHPICFYLHSFLKKNGIWWKYQRTQVYIPSATLLFRDCPWAEGSLILVLLKSSISHTKKLFGKMSVRRGFQTIQGIFGMPDHLMMLDLGESKTPSAISVINTCHSKSCKEWWTEQIKLLTLHLTVSWTFSHSMHTSISLPFDLLLLCQVRKKFWASQTFHAVWAFHFYGAVALAWPWETFLSMALHSFLNLYVHYGWCS